jgi:SynChlorMet cassette protein ScmC
MRYALYPILDGAVCDGGLPLHAALVEREGVGILIAAASGVGKSTCCRRLPAPWNVLSDDMSLVVPAADGIWQAHPLPTWSAIKAGEVTWPCRINTGIPVEAIFFLIRSETDGVDKLGRGVSAIGIKDNSSICFHYLDRYFHEAHHRPLRKKIFDNAVLLTARLLVYALRASLHGRFWEKIEEVLGQVKLPVGGFCGETACRKKVAADS